MCTSDRDRIEALENRVAGLERLYSELKIRMDRSGSGSAGVSIDDVRREIADAVPINEVSAEDVADLHRIS